MPWNSKQPDLKNNPAYLEPRVTAVESSLAQIATNVKSFGAKGDGINDDTTAIQNAINYAISNGYGKVYFPDGTYLISSTLQVTAKIALVGQSKVNTIIQTNIDINMIDLHTPCELMGFTFSINLATHSHSVIRYFAIQGGSKNGLVRDIYIIGLDGYQNTTKAIEFVQENGTTGAMSWLMFWNFEDIYIEFCQTGWYTQADFTLCWTTGCTFSNVIMERCVRGAWFNTTYLAGYYSRYDFIACQFQSNPNMNHVFEAPSDRSIVDFHVWDKSSYSSTPTAFYIKGNSRNNIFKIRNVDHTQLTFEKPYSTYQNRFEFSDDVISKNIMSGATVYVDPVNGNNSTGDGSSSKPYQTISQVLTYLPSTINGNSITINLAAGTYNESINLSNYDGGGLINIIGAGSTTILTGYINVNSNRTKLIIKNMTIQGNNGGTAVTIVDSEYATLDGVNVNPASTITNGIYIQAGRALVRNNNITNCTNAITSTTTAHVRIDSVTGSGNTNGYTASNSSYIGYTTAQPGGFATNAYVKASGGVIVSNTGIMQAADQSNSVATDVPTLVTDFNNLLTKLKNAGLML